MISTAKCTAIGLLTVSSFATPVAAEQLTYSFGFPTQTAIGEAAENFAAAVEDRSGGDVTVRNFPMTLMSLLETGPGIRDGLADIGYVLAPYYAAEYPHYSLLHELTMSVNLRDMTGKENLAYAGAITEFTFENCDRCREDFAAQNQVYLSGATSSIYSLLCTTPVVSQEDLQNKKIRAGSPSFSRFAEHFGATGIQMASDEVFEGLSQGVLDCAMLSAPELTTHSLKDVVSDVTLGVPGGIYAGAAVGNMNMDSWQALTETQRDAVLWGAHILSADISWNYYEREGKNREMAAEMGINIHEASEEFREEIRDYVRDDLKRVANIFEADYGVENAQAMIDEFLPVLDTWYERIEEVETREAYRALFWDEIYSGISAAKYGI